MVTGFELISMLQRKSAKQQASRKEYEAAALHATSSTLPLTVNSPDSDLHYSDWAQTDFVLGSMQGEVRSRVICIHTYSSFGKCLKNFRVAVLV